MVDKKEAIGWRDRFDPPSPPAPAGGGLRGEPAVGALSPKSLIFTDK